MKPSKKRTTKHWPIDLKVVPVTGGFALVLNNQPLVTDTGKPLQHASEHLLTHLVHELDGQGSFKVSDGQIISPKFFGALSLLCIQIDWIDARKDCLSVDFSQLLLDDRCLHPVAGPEQVEQYARWGPIQTWLGGQIDVLRNHAFQQAHGETEDTDAIAAATKQLSLLEKMYHAFKPEQRVVAMNLHAIHENAVLFPLALAAGKCDATEYALGMMASLGVLSGVFGDVTNKAHVHTFKGLRDDAFIALEYLRCVNDTQ